MNPALHTVTARPKIRRGAPTPAAELLRSLEDRLVCLDEALLLATAAHVFTPAAERDLPGRKPRLGFHRVEQPRRPPRRLRFTPLADEVDRVVIQNWNPHTGFVPIGDVEVELDPGQAVTLWINRASPAPIARDGPHEEPQSRLVLLSEEETFNL